MTKNFIKLMPGTKPQIQEAQRTKQEICPKKSIPRHTVFKLQKIKDKGKTLKEDRGKKHLPIKEDKNYI